jgi:hypothetical protein
MTQAPRSHRKHEDTQEDADAIILFINYILVVIGASKGAFSKDEILNRVFDPSFVEEERYANIIIESIPKRSRLEVMVEVYRRKEQGDLNKIRIFTQMLIEKLDEDDISKLIDIVSEELKTTNSNESIRISASILPIDFWVRLEESARIRSENKFIESIREGSYNTKNGKCGKGVLGTWGGKLLKVLVMRETCIRILLDNLEYGSKEKQDYVFQFFSTSLVDALNDIGETPLTKRVISLFKKKVEAEDDRFYQSAKFAVDYYGKFWAESLKKTVNDYKDIETSIISKEEEQEEGEIENEDITF